VQRRPSKTDPKRGHSKRLDCATWVGTTWLISPVSGNQHCRSLKATSVSKSKSDSIAERVQQIVLSFVVLVAYPKAFDLVAEVIA
jgi:hypothetical protein